MSDNKTRHLEPSVSKKNARGNKTRNPGFKPGDHWNICDLCGCAVRNSDTMLTWDGKVVCPDDWDYRHPQDFVRGVQEDTSPKGLTRPEPEDIVLTDIVNDTEDNQVPSGTFDNSL